MTTWTDSRRGLAIDDQPWKQMCIIKQTGEPLLQPKLPFY